MSKRATMMCTAINLENSREINKKAFNPIKVGVVGCGHRTRWNVLPKTITYQEYDLKAVCDIRPHLHQVAVQYAKDEFDTQINGYDDYKTMFKNEQLDAVILMLDPDKQIEIACQAMQAGMHVMAEVPLTYSLDDCWKVVIAAEQTGKKFMLMEQLRYSGYIRGWRNMLDKGVLGKPLFVEGQYFHYIPGMHFMDDDGWFYNPSQGAADPNAKPTWRNKLPCIGYLPHELSPLLYAINDRIVRVIGMSTRNKSYKHPELEYADTQVALMHTENDVIMRLAVAFSTPTDHAYCHWHHIKCTDGAIESPRTKADTFKMYVDGWQLPGTIAMPWSTQPIDAPGLAAGSGHGDLDYYVFAHFADSILYDKPLDIDVYQAVETAAPAILAHKSMLEENAPQQVPDFRPGPNRKSGEMPK